MDKSVSLAILVALALFFVLVVGMVKINDRIQRRRRDRRDRELNARLATLEPRRRTSPPA